jgi:MmyB-like transcription regulator ligand binding domain
MPEPQSPHPVGVLLRGWRRQRRLSQLDRHWNLVFANRMVALLLADVDVALLQPPANVLRLCLHPRGLAPRIANLALWRGHLLQRLRQQCAFTADAGLRALLDELLRLAPNGAEADAAAQGALALALPLHLHTAHGLLRLISTTTVFGAPMM